MKAALVALCAVLLVPLAADAKRLRFSPRRDPAATLARWEGLAGRVAMTQRCADCTRFGLGVARALIRQRSMVLGAARGVFAGAHPVTGQLKVVHLELVAEDRLTRAITLRAEHLEAGAATRIVTTQLTPGADGIHRSADGATSVRVIPGRGLFAYNDPEFVDSPE